MKDNRLEVLARVRESLQSALLPSARATIPTREVGRGVEPSQLLGQFMRQVDAVGMKLYCPTTAAEARDAVIGLLREKGREFGTEQTGGPASPAVQGSTLGILAWEESELRLEGLGEAMRDAGITRLGPVLPADPAGRRARLGELGRAVVGLTGALAGLADTGSLVLSSGPTRPRLASLLPPVHIAVVGKSTLYPTMAAFFSAQADAVREASNLVFITGPSRTADIEQTLTIGVHGPRQVHVVLVD